MHFENFILSNLDTNILNFATANEHAGDVRIELDVNKIRQHRLGNTDFTFKNYDFLIATFGEVLTQAGKHTSLRKDDKYLFVFDSLDFDLCMLSIIHNGEEYVACIEDVLSQLESEEKVQEVCHEFTQQVFKKYKELKNNNKILS